MAIIVKKFGGTSLGTIERIDFLAAKIAREREPSDQIVLVVSAMAKTTDYLFSLAYQVSDNPYQRELDMLVTAGERISMSLLSMALHKYGAMAISFTGSQSGIITDDCHGNAQITNVNAFRIKEELSKGKIVIVAGFQGVSAKKEVTTLGRGGSDTTAVALAGYLNAAKCQIYTDVEGVFSADPNLIAKPVKAKTIDYERMLVLAESGCKVIHPRAVEFALKYNIPVEIKSSFEEKEGTMMIMEADMEERELKAITGLNRLTAFQLNSEPDNRTSLMSLLQQHENEIINYSLLGNNLWQIITNQNTSQKVEQKLLDLNVSDYSRIDGLSSVTFVGLRIKTDMGFVSSVICCIKDYGIDIYKVEKNSSGFTIYMYRPDNSDVIRNLHERFIVNNY